MKSMYLALANGVMGTQLSATSSLSRCPRLSWPRPGSPEPLPRFPMNVCLGRGRGENFESLGLLLMLICFFSTQYSTGQSPKVPPT